MSELLVSVRSAVEAARALQGGAAVIDVKDPTAGSLGRASEEVIRTIVQVVQGRCPVSVALGELTVLQDLPCLKRVRYVKTGLSGRGGRKTWQQQLECFARRLADEAPGCQPVAVAYADWGEAQAPRPLQVAAFAAAQRWPVCLIDTWSKTRGTLLDCVSLSELRELARCCRRAGVRMALAGSLDEAAIRQLAELQPAWFAVRRAACRHNRREGTVSIAQVRRLVRTLRGLRSATSNAS